MSSTEQNPDRQIEAIRRYAPDIQPVNIFMDKQSGKNFDRPKYQALKGILENVSEAVAGREPIELVIKEVDRLGRNSRQIKEELLWFREHGVTVRILELPTTLTDAGGNDWVMEMVSNILIEVYASLAEQETEKRAVRQQEGIELAKQRGVYRGRKPVEVNQDMFKTVYLRWQQEEITAKEAMDILGLKRATFYRKVRQYEDKNGRVGLLVDI